MPETITLHALDFSGETTLKLFLRKNDGTLLNTGGDLFTEISSSGVFQATLSESRTNLGTLNARVCLSTETADNLVYDEALPEASTTLGTAGDATLAKQEEILTALDSLSAVQLAAVEVDAGTISGFPETLTIGDSYSIDTGQIRIDIKDSVTNDPIDALGSLAFADADVTFTAFRPNDSARITGSCEYVREPSIGTLTASYVLVTLLTSETAKGKAEYTYEGRLKFVWQGPSSSDETDEEQKTYKTTPFKFIANP